MTVDDIIDEIEKVGYIYIGELSEKQKEINKNVEMKDKMYSSEDRTDKIAKSKYSELVVAGIITLGIYLIIKNTTGFNYIPEVSFRYGLWDALFIGLLTSLHCVAMCGGINLSVCMSYNSTNKTESKASKFFPAIIINAGRVILYDYWRCSRCPWICF